MTFSIQSAGQKSAIKRSIVFGIIVAALLPGQLLAQDCNLATSVGFQNDNDSGPFELNEVIPLRVGFDTGPAFVPTTFEIKRFDYLLDCEGFNTFDECKAAGVSGIGLPGNTIEFLGNVATTCEIPGGADAVMVTTELNSITVEFAVTSDGSTPSSIELQSLAFPPLPPVIPTNSCEVTFDVAVTALSGENATKRIVEWTGFGGTDATCTLADDDPIEAASTAQVQFFVNNPNSVFWVTKDFTDDNESEVDIHFRCDTGIILNEDFAITDPATDGTFDIKGFIVYGIPSIGANCTIYEDPIPEGYSPSYEASAIDAIEGVDYDELGELDDDEGCYYDGVHEGEYLCEITNTGEPAEFKVTKEWIINNNGGVEVEGVADITISCNSDILEGVPEADPDEGIVAGYLVDSHTKRGSLEDGESLIALVDTTLGPIECDAYESINESGVEAMDDCVVLKIPPGGTYDCTFVNTVFFEGIPTLNQYGMILMTLLMLGLGMMGFRRFS